MPSFVEPTPASARTDGRRCCARLHHACGVEHGIGAGSTCWDAREGR
ncbi:MAG: hypothetical protein AVDCRST_MAG20-1053 [uncultured Acidimicrobiales bacterium]|uniref:Uncharacterized protein n=1 Tax=uncultured Acidimicrobiales bacterium TaxID=310071 RepID=A0A6J4HQ94_9ACTN|nr:MAG: hypothetical protein AVDCRST_MAG20-1053 [uncultured Acidimicrobiales bacterium]